MCEMKRELINPYSSCPLAGFSFAKVFVFDPLAGESRRWRIKGSGCNGPPEGHLATREVLRICWDAGLPLTAKNMGSPANCNSYHRDCAFLDGGLHAETGNYMFQPKGAWVAGSEAILFLAMAMRLRIRPSWLKRFGLLGLKYSHLEKAIRDTICQNQLVQRPKKAANPPADA
jgi:hypothetical protein